MKYENRHQPLAPLKTYYARILRNLIIAICVLFVCMTIGTVGYHYLADLHWLDAMHNAAMILAGMGPIFENPYSLPDAGKWFSSIYALFSGIVFLTNVGFILAPAIHRLFHKLRLEEVKS